jgi:hypothetical protein
MIFKLPQELQRELAAAIKHAAWCRWYSARLDSGEPAHAGYEQDLFEAFGCVGVVDARRGGGGR